MSGAGEPAARRFVIFAAPRTGSNWLCSLLDSHPEILCHHEIFNPERIIYSLSLRGGELDLGTVEERDRRPRAVIERVWQEAFGRRWVGFKLNRGQNRQAFETALSDPMARKIVIKRRNRVKLFVSEKLALTTGIWESYPWSEAGPEKRGVRVSLDELRDHIAMNERYYGWLERSFAERDEPHLEVTYEQLGTAGERARLLAFLGLSEPDGGLETITRKQNPKDLREIVVNFDQLAAEIAGSELEAEFYDRDL